MLDVLLFRQMPQVVEKLYPGCVCRKEEVSKTIYLTFDDGPTEGITNEVLKTLAAYNAKASFFCIGKKIIEQPGLFHRIIDEGHTVGNHTFHHYNGWKTKNKTYFDDVEACDKLFTFTYFRPPYGKLTPSQFKYLRNKHTVILWDVLTFDFDVNISKEDVLNNAITYSRNGSVVVFHDSEKAGERMLYALPKTLEHFSNQGYSFKAL
jgi:peptidoglycan/xylan/chitin deacetylase (PgdA/CDA1 family)